jgi:hypothetical protein
MRDTTIGPITVSNDLTLEESAARAFRPEVDEGHRPGWVTAQQAPCPAARSAPSSSPVVERMDQAVARVLRVQPHPLVPREAIATTSSRPFETPLLLAGVRCTLRYIVLPFVLPLGFWVGARVAPLVGRSYHPSLGKTTSSRLEAWPNTPGILSEYAQLTCDMRHPDPATLAEMMARVRRVMEEAAAKAQVETEIVDEWVYGSEAFDPDCVALVRDAAERLGVPHRDILSQAGHDAFNMALFCPTAMIFCPCKDGITHNEAEDCTLEDTVPSVDVLLHALLARADR